MLDSTRTQSALRRCLVFALPSLATAARFRNGFVFDDVFVIERGQLIHDLGNLPRAFTSHAMVASSQDQAVGAPAMDTYRPVSIASFFWDAALSGKHPWAYHLTSLLLHGLVCVLVLSLLDTLLPRVPARMRLCLACWFGLAPWLAEAHVFINGRSDLLLGLFFIAALLSFRAALQRASPAWAAASGGALLMALLSKEIAVVLLPFVIAVPAVEVPLKRRLAYGSAPVVALLLYLGARFVALAGLRTHSDTDQLLLALRNLPLLLVDGLSHALLPTPYVLRSLRDDYASAGMLTVLACSLVITLGVGVLLYRLVAQKGTLAEKEADYTLLWSVVLSLVSLSPPAMISTALWPGFGRYLYVPAIGLCVGLALVIHALSLRFVLVQRLWLPGCVLVLCVCAGLLLDATLDFVSETTLYANAIKRRPEQAWTHGFMGLSLRRAGRCDEALGFLNVAATRDPADPRYATHLGRCLVDVGAHSAALGVAERGRARFRDTRAEPGFLLIAALALPSSQTGERETLLERCLALDRGRTDCAQLLAQLRDASPRPSYPVTR